MLLAAAEDPVVAISYRKYWRGGYVRSAAWVGREPWREVQHVRSGESGLTAGLDSDDDVTARQPAVRLLARPAGTCDLARDIRNVPCNDQAGGSPGRERSVGVGNRESAHQTSWGLDGVHVRRRITELAERAGTGHLIMTWGSRCRAEGRYRHNGRGQRYNEEELAHGLWFSTPALAWYVCRLASRTRAGLSRLALALRFACLVMVR